MRAFILGALLLLSVLCGRSQCASLSVNEITNSAGQIQSIADPHMESNILGPLLRTKRQSHLSVCLYCCNCCKRKGCRFCCLT